MLTGIGVLSVYGVSMRVVSYLRVSTKKQLHSGLGLDAQREYCARACAQNGWVLAREFVDTASGVLAPDSRPVLLEAIALAKKLGATLLVAKLDRLSRDVEHIAGMIKRVPFRVATMPNADAFQLHLFAALAQQEHDFIAQRTRDALRALKERAVMGDVLAREKIARRDAGRRAGQLAAGKRGSHTATKAAVHAADDYAHGVYRHVMRVQKSGTVTLAGIAECLDALGIKTRRGASFTPTAVARVIARCQHVC